MKTKEERIQYLKDWRKRNRESYLKKKRDNYQKNKEGYREAAKERARRYYYSVLAPKRKENPDFYKKLDRERFQRKYEKRKATMRALREGGGGKCVDCGYSENIDILQFHHHNGGKDGDVASMQSLKKMVIEAKKCILLCPNCHAIRHLKHD